MFFNLLKNVRMDALSHYPIIHYPIIHYSIIHYPLPIIHYQHRIISPPSLSACTTYISRSAPAKNIRR
ncbi:hypothetical protein EGI32_02430 [Ferruginibacter sp. HRS2-29]|nr:hypothetical protein [Ferruginibacter sp. HRS2-29]